MILEFRCERARQWMNRAALSVNDQDVPVRIAWTNSTTPQPAGLEALFELERILLRKGKPGGADKLKAIPERRVAGNADVVVDFTTAGRDPACSAKLYLRPLFNGAAGEDAALAAILAGDLPVIEIINECDGATLDRGQPSGEIAIGLSGALDTVGFIRAKLAGSCRSRPSVLRRSVSGHMAGKNIRLLRRPRSSRRKRHHFRD
jgi:hypothetical protein